MNFPFLYAAFNSREINKVLDLMHSDVEWPNTMVGKTLNGKESVREYWTHQWQEINPTVVPEDIEVLKDGRLKIKVHQIVKDMEGKLLFDGYVYHVYSINDGLITKMEVEES
jgi:nuclear transport factor 2 (NTF2) superfamily protein